MATVPQEGTDGGVDLGVLADLTGYHLRRASTAFAADFARALDGTGMRQVLFGVLSVVAANPGINQGMVGRSLGIKRANMVALINELVDLKLVEREVAKDDRRAFSLRASRLGDDTLDQYVRRIRAHEDGMLADLSADERGFLVRLLMRIEAKDRG